MRSNERINAIERTPESQRTAVLTGDGPQPRVTGMRDHDDRMAGMHIPLEDGAVGDSIARDGFHAITS